MCSNLKILFPKFRNIFCTKKSPRVKPVYQPNEQTNTIVLLFYFVNSIKVYTVLDLGECFFKKTFKDDFFRRFLKIKPSTTIIFWRFAKSSKRCFFEGFGHFSCHFLPFRVRNGNFSRENVSWPAFLAVSLLNFSYFRWKVPNQTTKI